MLGLEQNSQQEGLKLTEGRVKPISVKSEVLPLTIGQKAQVVEWAEPS